MVQGIRPGKPQVTVSPPQQQSLFGTAQGARNGTMYPLDAPKHCQRKHGKCLNTDICKGGTCLNLADNVRRTVSEKSAAEQARARDKIANTSAGKTSTQVVRTETYNRQPREATKPKAPLGPPCHHTHPPYPVADGFTVIGGSGITPFNKDCDIYCSLDHNGVVSMPWEASGPYAFVFEIKNYGVPHNVEEFKKLINWLEDQIKKGRKVHVGCMAGHGRTGMVLAALRMQMAGDKDAIMHVRNNYCDQAVETEGQIKWLMEQYGMNTAPPRVKKYKGGPDVSASGAGAVRHGNWHADNRGEFDTGFDSANKGRFDGIEREPQHTSWVANSPWLIELEGPAADLPHDAAWYDDGDPA